MSRNKPRRAVEVHATKEPRRPKFTPDEADSKLIILMSRADVGSQWCLTKISPMDHAELLRKIRQWETMTVHQLFDQGEEPGKDYPLECIVTAAQERLRELTYDDRDRISRLRLSGKKRLYGFREGHRFYVIWWDPQHEICLSTKRHT